MRTVSAVASFTSKEAPDMGRTNPSINSALVGSMIRFHLAVNPLQCNLFCDKLVAEQVYYANYFFLMFSMINHRSLLKLHSGAYPLTRSFLARIRNFVRATNRKLAVND
jgi:hypothetical protein